MYEPYTGLRLAFSASICASIYRPTPIQLCYDAAKIFTQLLASFCSSVMTRKYSVICTITYNNQCITCRLSAECRLMQWSEHVTVAYTFGSLIPLCYMLIHRNGRQRLMRQSYVILMVLVSRVYLGQIINIYSSMGGDVCSGYTGECMANNANAHAL